jgi:hypothetical protein
MLFALIAVAAPITAFAAELPPTDTQLRAAFCMGVIERGIAAFAEPMPPMYVTPDGRSYTPTGNCACPAGERRKSCTGFEL